MHTFCINTCKNFSCTTQSVCLHCIGDGGQEGKALVAQSDDDVTNEAGSAGASWEMTFGPQRTGANSKAFTNCLSLCVCVCIGERELWEGTDNEFMQGNSD